LDSPSVGNYDYTLDRVFTQPGHETDPQVFEIISLHRSFALVYD